MNVFLPKYILRSSTSSVFLKIMKSTCTPKKGPDMFQMAAKDISGLGSLADLRWARSGFPEQVVSLGTKFFPYFIIIGWWVVTSTDMRPINWPVTQHSVTKTTTICETMPTKASNFVFFIIWQNRMLPQLGGSTPCTENTGSASVDLEFTLYCTISLKLLEKFLLHCFAI